MPIFGYNEVGSSIQLGPSWRVEGSVFACPEAGTLEKISAFLAGTYPGPEYAKAAIYRHSDLALVAVSSEVELPDPMSRWYDFPVSAALTAQDYILVVLATANWGLVASWASYGDSDQSHHQNRPYNMGFPDPLVPTHGDWKHSIYATYTAGGGGGGGGGSPYYYREFVMRGR